MSGLANILEDRNEIPENTRVTFNIKSSSVRKQKSEAQLHDGEYSSSLIIVFVKIRLVIDFKLNMSQMMSHRTSRSVLFLLEFRHGIMDVSYRKPDFD